MTRVISIVWLVLIGTCSLTGCGPHQLRGVVVAGTTTGIDVVSTSELPASGLADAQVQVVLNPTDMDRQHLPIKLTTSDGRFAFDPKWLADYPSYLDLEAEISVAAPGVGSLRERITLPRGEKQLLIRLTDPALPGSSPGTEDLYQEALRHRDAFDRR